MQAVSGHQRFWLVLATYMSVAVATTLIVIKAGAWFMTGSASLLASLTDSVMDSLASVVNLLAVRLALKPADEQHRFGHGKAEPIAAVAQSAFILGSALVLVLYCIDRLMGDPEPLDHTGVGVGVMIAAIVLTLALVVVQRQAIRHTGSKAIGADHVHYFSDLLTNAGVILALFLAQWGWQRADLIIGLVIAGYMSYSAIHIGHEAIQLLMDRELPDDVVNEVAGIALDHPGVQGVHEFRTRQSGLTYMMELHLEIAPETPLHDAHRIGDEVVQRIRQRYPNSDIIIHHDPADLVEQGQGYHAQPIRPSPEP